MKCILYNKFLHETGKEGVSKKMREGVSKKFDNLITVGGGHNKEFLGGSTFQNFKAMQNGYLTSKSISFLWISLSLFHASGFPIRYVEHYCKTSKF